MRRGQLCLRSPSGFLPTVCRTHRSARCNRAISLVGKPTIFSNLNRSLAVPLIEGAIAPLGPFHRAHSTFSLSTGPQFVQASLYGEATESALLRLPNGAFGTALNQGVLRLLYLNALVRAANCIGLTRASSAGYACIPKGESSCSNSTATPSGSCPGNSWRTLERNRVLTPFQGRSVENLCSVQCGRFPDRSARAILRISCIRPQPSSGLLRFFSLLCEFSISVSGQELGAA